MRRGETTALTLLLALAATLPAGAAQVRRDAQGAGGGSATAPGIRLGYSVGLPSIGMATTGVRRELAGFWIPPAPPASGVPEAPPLPTTTRLRPAHPNPFASRTEFLLEIGPREASSLQLRVDIFDAAGRRTRTLVEGRVPAGIRSVTWDGRDDLGRAVPSGVYFVRLTGPGVLGKQKVIRVP